MKNLLSVFALLIPMLYAFTTNPQSPETSCAAPTNVHVVGIGYVPGTISFDWDDCNGSCTGYIVRYQRLSDGYTSQDVTVTSSNHTFTGLQVGNYKFFFETQCNSEKSNAIVIEDRIII